MTRTPRFCAVMDRAEEIAITEQAYEVAHLITAEGHDRAAIERRMTPRDLRRYDAIIYRAWLELSLKSRVIGRLLDDNT